MIIQAQPGPQENFLASEADIAIYGGAAGGGKTFALLVEPLRHVNVKGFEGVIFRRTYPEIASPGGLWDVAQELYGAVGCTAKANDLSFHFPQGATVSFWHLNNEKDKNKYQGSQICYLAFDELTHFSQSQFFYLLSRNRSMCGVRPYVRCSCNPVPSGEPGGWVADLIAWWIDQETGFPIKERSGVLRWFIRQDNEFIWAETRQELKDQYPMSLPLSLTFIPASLSDNQILMRTDPGYLAKLMSLNYIDRMRLLDGNWKVTAEAGKVFNRDWFAVEHVLPEGGAMVRFWDFAATEKSLKSQDPDFAAAVLMRRVNRKFYVEDCVWGQWSPSQTLEQFEKVTREDLLRSQELGCSSYAVRWEQEPGSASKLLSSHLTGRLAGVDARGVLPGKSDKITRAMPFAAQCEHGNVTLRAGRWVAAWLAHMHSQPMAVHEPTGIGSGRRVERRTIGATIDCGA